MRGVRGSKGGRERLRGGGGWKGLKESNVLHERTDI